MNRRFRRPPINREETYNVDEFGWFYGNANPPMPNMGSAKHAPHPEEQIPIQSILQVLSHMKPSHSVSNIHSIMNDLGIKKGSQFFNVDISPMEHYTYHIGDQRAYQTKETNSIISRLKLGLSYSIMRNKDNDMVVNGFSKSRGNWKDNTKGKIKIKDHHEHEPLVCPMCETEYTDPKDILLAQTVVHHGITAKISASDTDDIRILRPHIVLTPICPNCYCDQVIEEGKRGFSKTNVSPVFVLPDQDKHLVPLLPKCTIEKLDTTENANVHTNSSLFWPMESKDILCTTLMSAEHICEIMQSIDE